MSTKSDAVAQPELERSNSSSLSEKLSSDAPSVAELPELQKGDAVVPAKVWAKIDLYVLPVVTLMYFLSSLVGLQGLQGVLLLILSGP